MEKKEIERADQIQVPSFTSFYYISLGVHWDFRQTHFPRGPVYRMV